MIRRAFFTLGLSSLLAACSSAPTTPETLQAMQIGEISFWDTEDYRPGRPHGFLRWLPDESGVIICDAIDSICAKRLDGKTIWRFGDGKHSIRHIVSSDTATILALNETHQLVSIDRKGRELARRTLDDMGRSVDSLGILWRLDNHGDGLEGQFYQGSRFGLDEHLQLTEKKEFLVHGNGALQFVPAKGKPNWELLIPQEAAERVENPKENERISVIGPQGVEQYFWDGSDRIFYSIGGGCWAGDDGVLHLYSRRQNRELWAIKTSMYRQVFAVDFAHQRLAVGGKSGKGALLRLLDFDGHLLGEVRLSADQEPQRIALSPSGRRIAFFGRDHKLSVYEMKR